MEMILITATTILLFLAIFAYFDLKSRHIPVTVLVAYGIIAVVLAIISGTFATPAFVIRLVPGLLLVFISFITKEAVGYGDGLVILVTGLLIDIMTCLTFIMAALLISAVVSVVILVAKKGNRATRLAFMPCLLLAWIIVNLGVPL